MNILLGTRARRDSINNKRSKRLALSAENGMLEKVLLSVVENSVFCQPIYYLCSSEHVEVGEVSSIEIGTGGCYSVTLNMSIIMCGCLNGRYALVLVLRTCQFGAGAAVGRLKSMGSPPPSLKVRSHCLPTK